MEATSPQDLTWLLEDFAQRTTHVRAVLVTSRDGLKRASYNVTADNGVPDTISAAVSGVQSLAEGVSRYLGGNGVCRQSVLELDTGCLFTMAAGHGAVLSVLVDEDADAGQVAYDMGLLVKRVPEYLSVDARTPHVPGRAG
jgi:predicted regulator of Ras-like GTPase activity (Roadblock/LC7/MglB family)